MDKKSFDNFVYDNCVSGNCPLIVEEMMFGCVVSSCEQYCGTPGFSGCKYCYFEESDMCLECVHNIN